MTDSAEIIMFPGSGDGHPTTLEEIDQRMQLVRETHIDRATEMFQEIFIEDLTTSGFNIDPTDPKFSKDIALVTEAVRSLMMKYYGYDYPLQPLAQRIYVDFENEDGTMIVPRYENIEVPPKNVTTKQ